MRKDLSCFGESSVQIADAASSSSSSSAVRGGGGGGKGAAQNQVSCLYQARLSGRPCMISVTWSKGLVGMQGLSVSVDDATGQCLCKADVKPWLFSKKKGSKSVAAGHGKIEIFWDLSGAKFGPGPEPLEGFYVTVVFDREMVLLLGDLKKDAYRKTCAVRPALSTLFLARKEHIHGKKIYSAKAQFCGNGQYHDIVIECDSVGLKDPCLEIRIDKKPVMQVKRLAWKFRGNQTIMVDGLPVEVFWDVHSWLFSSTTSNAVFMFQTCPAPQKSIPWIYSQIFRESQLQVTIFITRKRWSHEGVKNQDTPNISALRLDHEGVRSSPSNGGKLEVGRVRGGKGQDTRIDCPGHYNWFTRKRNMAGQDRKLRSSSQPFVPSLMGWLHSLFSPIRRLWVRAHSRRRNRRGMHILYKDVQSCQDEDVQILWSIFVDSHRHPALMNLKL